MAAPLTLKTAIGAYRYTQPLKNGTVTSPRLCLDHVEVVPVNRAFRPMVNQLAYDVSELALVTYLLALTVGRPLVGVPVVLMQQSAYNLLLVPRDSPLTHPRQLSGRTIGVRSFTQTTGVWLRGMLHDQFNLDLDSLSWVTLEAAHVDGFEDPPNVRRLATGAKLAELLDSGQIEAAAGLEPAEHPRLRTLIPHAAAVEEEWIRQSRIQPINHTLVVRQDILSASPWVADELYSMVRAAKAAANNDRPVDGLDAMRDGLTTLARYAFEQHITPRSLSLQELYPAT